MFRFNFEVHGTGEQADNVTNAEIYPIGNNSENNTSSAAGNKSEKIFINCDALNNFDVYKTRSIEKLIDGNEKIVHLLKGFPVQNITDATSHLRFKNDQMDSLCLAEKEYSDLLPGVYEGGAKIWECTDDLLNYFCKLQGQFNNDFWLNKRVLDIGCGCGLLGIYAYKKGSKVDFQDYNKCVLEKYTIPNVLLNKKLESRVDDLVKKLNDNVSFYSGDWSDWLTEYPDTEVYDIILTAETIYNAENYEKLLNCLYAKLKPNGVIWLAAKTNYFGVGGSLRQFELLIRDKYKCFESQVVWSSRNGVNREILKIFKNKENVYS